MKYPRVGVVVLTCNSKKIIGECLTTLLLNRYRYYHVVVVDNASSDGTAGFIEENYPSIHIIRNEQNQGIAKGYNKGAKYLLVKKNCEYILFLNDDIAVSNRLIHCLVQPFLQDETVGIAGPIVTYHHDPMRIWYAGGYFNRYFCYTRHPNMNKKITHAVQKDTVTDFITGCCLMIRKGVIGKAGLFDEWLESYFEDVFLCLKARNAGYKSYLIAKPLVKHRVSSTLGKEGSNKMSPRRAYFFARNPILYIKKRVKGPLFLSNITGQFVIRLPYYAYQMIRCFDWKSLRAYFTGIYEGIVDG